MYSTNVWLPKIQKKIVYLDQFFFSGAFRENDDRFVAVAKKIRHLSDLQLLVVPFSSVHEEETHQWRGYGGKNKDDLMEFIKATSRGHEFSPAYDVEQTQINRAFGTFLGGGPTEFVLEERDVVRDDVHQWDDFFCIDVGRYIGDIGLIRDLKSQSVDELVDAFDDWQKSTNTFDEDVIVEFRAAAQSYFDYYTEYVRRLAIGDYAAVYDSPIISMVIQQMLNHVPADMHPRQRLERAADFFDSEHFRQIPYEWLSTRMFATLKDMVKQGAYANREQAKRRLCGFFHDVKHISTYAPYCDAFIMDQPMAALVANPYIRLEQRYGVRVFSLNTWDQLSAWLDEIESGMSDEHKTGLAAAYP